MNSLNNRLDRIDRKIGNDGEFKVLINWVENGLIEDCKLRRDGCPSLPCNRKNCWAKKPGSGIEFIEIGPEEID